MRKNCHQSSAWWAGITPGGNSSVSRRENLSAGKTLMLAKGQPEFPSDTLTQRLDEAAKILFYKSQFHLSLTMEREAGFEFVLDQLSSWLTHGFNPWLTEDIGPWSLAPWPKSQTVFPLTHGQRQSQKTNICLGASRGCIHITCTAIYCYNWSVVSVIM